MGTVYKKKRHSVSRSDLISSQQDKFQIRSWEIIIIESERQKSSLVKILNSFELKNSYNLGIILVTKISHLSTLNWPIPATRENYSIIHSYARVYHTFMLDSKLTYLLIIQKNKAFIQTYSKQVRGI